MFIAQSRGFRGVKSAFPWAAAIATNDGLKMEYTGSNYDGDYTNGRCLNKIWIDFQDISAIARTLFILICQSFHLAHKRLIISR